MRELKGKRALVTGASSGIGVSFARLLARDGAELVLTARRVDRLEALAEELRADCGVAVTVIPLDLTAPDAARQLFEQTEGEGRTIDVLINNAGFGTQGRFLEIPWERTFSQINLNVVSLTDMTWRFGRAMAARGAGHVLNVASVGAYLPTPGYATYGAGKAYVRNFTEAIALELAPTGVRVCCLCPGPTQSEFAEVAGHELASWQTSVFMGTERCARIGLRGLFGGRRNVVAGITNNAGMFLLRFLPRRAITWIAAKVMT